ncbi:MAG: type II secretion system protein [Pirellulales bacterium]
MLHLRRNAFSLVEFLAVATILGAIAALIVARGTPVASPQQQDLHEHNKVSINAAVERYYRDKGYWPAADLAEIRSDPAYFPDGFPLNPIDPSVPYTVDVETHLVDSP